jgi:hypothetical protein
MLSSPNVSFSKIRIDLIILFGSLIWAFAWLWYDIERGIPGLFQRAGVVVIIAAAIVEFRYLEKILNKHLVNAERALQGEQPLGVSSTRQIIGKLSFVFLLIGTLITGYGDFVVQFLL